MWPPFFLTVEVVLADYPCDLHLARYKGPSTRIYVNLFREDQEVRLKGSVCADCLAEACTEFIRRLLHETQEGVWDPPEEDAELEGLWKASGSPRNGRWPQKGR